MLPSSVTDALKGVEFEFDHIGIAVRDLESGRQFYSAMGWQEMPVEEVPTENVKVGMLKLGNNCKIELLEPTSDESPIAKFLAKRGPGVHHFCLRVKDIDGLLPVLKQRGIRLINDTPRPGAHGCRVAFIHPASAGGVLVELSQPPGRE